MIDRNRRGIRKVGMRGRLAIAAAVLVGGGAAGMVAVSANHGSTAAAQSAGYSTSSHQTIGEAAALSEALGSWSQSYTKSYSTLAKMPSMRTFSQVWNRHVEFADQRGIVVLATKKFLVVKSYNGSLHVWWLSGATHVKDVSSSATGMTAMTGSQWASNAAMSTGDMTPAMNVVAGSTTTVSQLTTTVAKPTTITIATGNVVITITVANTTATTTATTTSTTTSTTPITTTKTHQSAWWATDGVKRGDLVFVAGVRQYGELKAQLVLFAAPLNSMPSGSSYSYSTPSYSTPSSGSTFSGYHS